MVRKADHLCLMVIGSELSDLVDIDQNYMSRSHCSESTHAECFLAAWHCRSSAYKI